MQKNSQNKLYENLKNVPPPLQKYSKRFIDQRSKGLGTRNKTSPISTVYPPEMDIILRTLNNRSAYIRKAVLEKMRADKLLTNYSLPDE